MFGLYQERWNKNENFAAAFSKAFRKREITHATYPFFNVYFGNFQIDKNYRFMNKYII